MKNMILAIDPGTTMSAYCYIDVKTYKPLSFGKIPNEHLLKMLTNWVGWNTRGDSPDIVVIEMMESYGMKVGQSTFETCVWIGRFIQAAYPYANSTYIYRHEERMNLCHQNRAGDADVRHALIHRFAQKDKERGKGTKSDPDWFFGFSSDCWMAYAVGVTYLDKNKGDTHE